MQNKGIIKFAAIVLAILSLYALSFTFITKKVENDAKEYAKGDPIKERAYLDSISNQPVYPILGHTFSYVKQREIPLGLDLKGGMNVTMEIELSSLVRSLANNPTDSSFNKALKNAEGRLSTSQDGLIPLFIDEYEKINPNGKLSIFFATKENADDVKLNASNKDVRSFLEKQANSAVERSFNILRTRIDKFGVTQPNIQLQGGSNRILVELPGVTDADKNRVRKLLQGSAKLEFYETYDNQEIFPVLQNINNILAAKQPKTENKKSATADTLKADLKNKPALLSAKKDSTKKDSSNVEALAKSNPLFAILTPATYQGQNGQQSLRPGPTVGYANESDTAKVNAYLAQEDIKALLPANIKLLWGVKPVSADTKAFELFAIKPSGINGEPALGGDVISNAREDFDQRGNPEVVMVMKSEGARIWKNITAAAAGSPSDENDNKSVAIVLDNSVYTAPRVSGEIPNGISSISGNFTVDETKDLANVLKAGKLPAPAKIVQEAIVGPSLGAEAISSGLMSSVVGLIVVLIFMMFYYNRAGTVANIAVFSNVFFLMGVLASLGAVLTLPGIAGIVLTLGMAVDANVLIYERIREELGLGKSLKVAISDGYKHAMPSILDSQVTTLITGIILYVFGSGPIQGFATTLMIGIITSLFSAILISRLIFEWMLKKEMNIKFSNPWSDHTFKNANFPFVKKRKIFYLLSGTFITLGIISIIVRGFSFGVDFKGGRTYVVRFEKPVTTETVRQDLNETFGVVSEVKTFGSDDQVRVTTPYMIDSQADNADQLVEAKLKEGLAKIANNKGTVMSSQKVGPTIANDIKISAIYAVLLSIIAIALYIFIRFRKWSYSIGALVALCHDVLLVLSFFSLFNGILPFSLDIDQAFIAAILTVIGYSINDTVVVFDRIREFLNAHHAKTDKMSIVINDAINSTLSRTVITALTVIFVLAVLFVFGGDVIRGFSFALLIGVIFGTYSSICVATPVVVDFMKDENKD
ncbi:MAG: protein translocase subunit SecDF [Bacteroidetes bacterium]|nr:protein translocase subunit SecDF [Bacteroidota bacterium]MBU1373860.1 protein translocase subunit SecDF [Bacteroidota bacterium]MBU1483967.1 protein translocase subunit SecDF [Bacteroidota bacterium]MBU1760027.1 protein translocase subunit SecDF [Bacteroidota bacterium]MBU2045717.1 protein translocase subunit SecDF [Bacteroidota bacterium]